MFSGKNVYIFYLKNELTSFYFITQSKIIIFPPISHAVNVHFLHLIITLFGNIDDSCHIKPIVMI